MWRKINFFIILMCIHPTCASDNCNTRIGNINQAFYNTWDQTCKTSLQQVEQLFEQLNNNEISVSSAYTQWQQIYQTCANAFFQFSEEFPGANGIQTF